MAATWEPCGVSPAASPAATPAAGTTWLTIPELVELLGLPQGKIRRLLEERILLGTRVDGVLKVPSDFIDSVAQS